MTDSEMRGKLDAVPLIELLTALGRNERSGSLRLSSEHQTVTVSLAHGSVRSVSTNDPALRIGQILIQLGLTTEEQIEQALALQSIAADPERIGEVLVDVGYISGADINLAMATQIVSAVATMLNDADSFFVFEQPNSSPPAGARNGICDEALIVTILSLAEGWLERSGKGAQYNAMRGPAAPELEELPHTHHTLAHRALTLQDQLGASDSYRDSLKQRVSRCIDLIVAQLKSQDTSPNFGSADNERGSDRSLPDHQVFLVDQEIDIWQLADMTRSARQLLLDLLNGEDRLSVLLRNLKSVTGNPNRAVRELSSTGMIRIAVYKHDSGSAESGEAGRQGQIGDRTVRIRMLP